LGAGKLQENFAAGRRESKMNALMRVRKSCCKAAILVALCFTAVGSSGQETRKAIVQSSPVYPQMAKQFQLSGTVKVQVVIAPDGQIKDTKVLGGHPLLAESVLAALKKWKFAPSNTETTQVLEFNFKPT
jgi:TonB family protein